MALDGLIAILFGVEAFAAATALLGTACAYVYRQELRATCRRVLGQSSPSSGGNRDAKVDILDDAEITNDGREVAKMMLRASDWEAAEQLRKRYKRASHPEGRLFERFVDKAYIYLLDKHGQRERADEFWRSAESKDTDSVREDIEFAVLVGEAKAAAEVGDTDKPSEKRLKAASQNPGAGIRIAKLLEQAETRSEAEELLDIFNDAEIQRNKGAVYAAYAGALVRFGHLIDAGGMLISADRVQGLSEEELEEAKNRFFYPKQDGETVEDFADRLRKQGSAP